MDIVKVRKLEIGRGKPKIVVPIIGSKKEEILNEAKELNLDLVDIVEIRIDYFENVLDISKIKEVLIELSDIIPTIPILFTLRSKAEGGQIEINTSEYEDIISCIIKQKLIDIVDIELFRGDDTTTKLIDIASNNDVVSIISSHNFQKTPPHQEIIKIFEKMNNTNADILKLALMPKDKLDVLELIKATIILENMIQKPIVAISMSKIGMLSRFCGEIFKSSLTFGIQNKSSAPGQMEVKDLSEIIEIIHKNLEE